LAAKHVEKYGHLVKGEITLAITSRFIGYGSGLSCSRCKHQILLEDEDLE